MSVKMSMCWVRRGKLRMKKTISSLVLVLAVVFALAPLQAMATEDHGVVPDAIDDSSYAPMVTGDEYQDIVPISSEIEDGDVGGDVNPLARDAESATGCDDKAGCDDESDRSIWVWRAIGAGAVVVIVGAAWVVARVRKSKK